MDLIDFNDIDNFGKDYSEFEEHEDFKEFLEENGALDKFIENFYLHINNWRLYHWKHYKEGHTLKYFLDKETKYFYITSAFRWYKDKKEDYDYWSALNLKWIIRT
jgi:hypothetical protein